MTFLDFIEAGFNQAFHQLAQKQEEGFKMLANKITDLINAVAQTKAEIKDRFEKSDAQIADLTSQVNILKVTVADLQTKLQEGLDTTGIEQDLDAVITEIQSIGK